MAAPYQSTPGPGAELTSDWYPDAAVPTYTSALVPGSTFPLVPGTTFPRPAANSSSNSGTDSQVPVMGLPGINFWILHVTAEVSLTVSVVSSVAVFVILRPACPGFWRRGAGERFAIYLALGDLLYSIAHIHDHAYMMVRLGHPPDVACAAMGYFVLTFVNSQALIVTFISFNAYFMIVKETKISLGRYDWRFLMGTMGFPIIATIPCAALGMIGPSGGWCAGNMRNEAGRVLGLLAAVLQLITMVVNIFSYLFIYVKIRQVSAATAAMGHTSGPKYGKVAGAMMLFVAAFIFQWWTYVVWALWSIFAQPPFYITHSVVLLVNMGGFYNFIVYTLLRMKKPKKSQLGDNKGKSVSGAGVKAVSAQGSRPGNQAV